MYSSEDTEVDLPNDSGTHMLSDTAEAEVKNALADKYYRKEIRLTDKTPSIMLSQKGVRDFPLFMNASHLRENVFTEAEALQKGLKVEPGINYHGLGDVLFLDVIDKLDDITEAYRGTKNAEKPERREDYFLLISKLKDKDGNIINVPIYINTKAKQNNVFIDVNKMATVFGKSNINHYIAQELRKGNIVRIKKRSPQTSEWTTPIVADYGMDASSANSIAESEGDVNTPVQKSFSTPDTDITHPDIASHSMRRDLTTLESAKDLDDGRMFSAEETDVILPSEDIEALNLENIRLKAENKALREQFYKTKIKKPKAEDIERVGIGYFYVAFYYLSWYTFNNHYIPNNRKGEGICDT